jgi:hypothetical protein
MDFAAVGVEFLESGQVSVRLAKIDEIVNMVTYISVILRPCELKFCMKFRQCFKNENL